MIIDPVEGETNKVFFGISVAGIYQNGQMPREDLVNCKIIENPDFNVLPINKII